MWEITVYIGQDNGGVWFSRWSCATVSGSRGDWRWPSGPWVVYGPPRMWWRGTWMQWRRSDRPEQRHRLALQPSCPHPHPSPVLFWLSWVQRRRDPWGRRISFLLSQMNSGQRIIQLKNRPISWSPKISQTRMNLLPYNVKNFQGILYRRFREEFVKANIKNTKKEDWGNS